MLAGPCIQLRVDITLDLARLIRRVCAERLRQKLRVQRRLHESEEAILFPELEGLNEGRAYLSEEVRENG